MRIATLIVMGILSWGTAGWAAMGFDERYEQVNIVGGVKTAPRIDGRRADEAMRARWWKCCDNGEKVIGERVVASGRHRPRATRRRVGRSVKCGGRGCRREEGTGGATVPVPGRQAFDHRCMASERRQHSTMPCSGVGA
jgi:hypothetical protein